VRWTLATLPILFVGAYLLRGILVAPWLSGLLERAIEQHTGVGVAVGPIEGGWLGRVHVRGLRTVRPGVTGPFVSLEIDEATARYSPGDLLRGTEAFIAGTRIEVNGARVVLNLAPAPDRGQGAGGILATCRHCRFAGSTSWPSGPGCLRANGVSVDTGDARPPAGREGDAWRRR
jgi:hypothetical protein